MRRSDRVCARELLLRANWDKCIADRNRLRCQTMWKFTRFLFDLGCGCGTMMNHGAEIALIDGNARKRALQLFQMVAKKH